MNSPAFTRLLGFSCALAALVALDAAAQDARTWLDRMARAVEELNYEGTFVHVLEGNAETMHIVHRNHRGVVAERLLSLDGVGREIIREEDMVRMILPDRQVVLLESRTDQASLVTALPNYSADLEPHYEFTLHETARVAKRPVQVVGIKPRDAFRYGYKLWLDRETAMPLKSQLLDESGRVIEEILFTQLQISEFIPASALYPGVDTSGYTFLRSPDLGSAELAAETAPSEPAAESLAAADPSSTHSSSAERSSADPSWRASMLPGGFRLSAATTSAIAGSTHPVEHLVYSDGLATVSVFIEDPNSSIDVTDVADGFSRLGSTNAFSVTLNGRKITAVGEVPEQTVRSIAMSLSAE